MTAPTEPCPATSVSRKSTKRKVKIRAARLVWALILLGGILYAFLYRQAVMAWFYHTEYFPSDGGMYTIGAPNCASEMDPSRCELPLASCSDQTCPAYSEAAYAQCPDGLSDSTDAPSCSPRTLPLGSRSVWWAMTCAMPRAPSRTSTHHAGSAMRS